MQTDEAPTYWQPPAPPRERPVMIPAGVYVLLAVMLALLVVDTAMIVYVFVVVVKVVHVGNEVSGLLGG